MWGWAGSQDSNSQEAPRHLPRVCRALPPRGLPGNVVRGLWTPRPRYLDEEVEQLLLGERDEALAVLLGPVAGLRGVPHHAVLPHLGRQ